MATWKCSVCGKGYQVPRLPWHVRCCPVYHEPGSVQPEKEVVFRAYRSQPCVYRGKDIGEYDCQCQGKRSAFECEKLWTIAIDHTPGKDGRLNGEFTPRSMLAQCIDCEHYETEWRNRTVFWQKPTTPIEMPLSSNRAVVTVAVGSEWEGILSETRPFMQRYAERIGADFIALTNKTQQWGPLEKFRCREILEHYDSIIFIDADVLVMPDAMDLKVDGVAMFDDLPDIKKVNDSWIESEWDCLAQSQSLSKKWNGRALNTGIIACSKEYRDILTPPPKPFKATHCAEQFWIDHNAGEMGVKVDVLQWRWNKQWWHEDFKSAAPSAHFIHFASSPNRKRDIASFIQEHKIKIK